MDNQKSQLYHRYSLVRTEDGVIFKAFGSLEILHFTTEDRSWRKTKLAADLTQQQLVQMQLVQPRDFTDFYATEIWAFYQFDSLHKVSFSDKTSLTLVPRVKVSRFSEVKSEHLDLGKHSMALLSPVNCGVNEVGHVITSTSVHFYSLESGNEIECWDLDTVLQDKGTKVWFN